MVDAGRNQMTVEDLEAEYCPPLDPALLRSIVSDYTDDSIHEARNILDELKETTLIEEEHLGFDASGSAAPVSTLGSEASKTASSTNTSAERLSETDSTSISNDLSSLNIHKGDGSVTCALEDGEMANNLDGLDEDTKLSILLSLFGEKVPAHTISHTLRGCNGNFSAAMDQLLNQVYFSETGHEGTEAKVSYKGVDAFSEDQTVRRKRKGKGSGRNRKAQVSDLASDSLSQPATQTMNKWQTSSRDVQFIADRTGMATTTVSSIYHTCAASVPDTIAAILKARTTEVAMQDSADDSAIKVFAQELKADFPSLTHDQSQGLVRLTHPSTVAAHELAKAMTSTPHASRVGGIHIIPQYRPATVDILQDVPVENLNKRPGSSQLLNLDVAESITQVGHATARSAAASEQAEKARRLAKSKHSMRGVASYYDQVRREYSQQAFEALASVADGIAASQSSASQLDLHGIDVMNAVRIAKAKVEDWYTALGEDRYNGRVGAGNRGNGFSIIVGRGIHSQGGRPRIGPAVSKMLRENGWRFEAAGAVIVVKGRGK